MYNVTTYVPYIMHPVKGLFVTIYSAYTNAVRIVIF